MWSKGRSKTALLEGILVLVLIVTGGVAQAAVGQGNPDVSTVTSAIHSAGEVEATFERFSAALDRYAAERSRCEGIVDPNEKAKCDASLRKLLEEAGDLLAKLNEQADRIEATVAAHKKKIDKDLSVKLDRVLDRVTKVRQEANSKMKTAPART